MSSKDKSKKKRKRNYNFFYNFVKFTGALSVLLWIRPKVIYCGTGKKKIKGGALVVSNHVAFTDPLKLLCALWYRIPRFIATKDLFNHKMADWFFTKMHCIKVDKENFNMNTFHEVSEELANKKVVIIFPEGKINETSVSPMQFKSGAILMAYKSGVPVVPICIVERKKWYHREVVLIGDRVDIRERCGNRPSLEALSAVSEELRQTETELMQNYLSRKRR